MAAGDAERAVQMIEGRVITMMDCGQSSSLADYLDGLPNDAVRSQPWACIARAGALAYAGRLTAVEPLLQSAHEVVSGLDDSVEMQRIDGHIAAIKGYTALLGGELKRAIELAQEALDLLSEGDLLPRCFAAMTLGTSLRVSGELEAATQAFSEAIELCHSPANGYVAVVCLCDLGAVQLEQGKLQQAALTCQKALQIGEQYSRRSGRPLPSSGYAHGILSFALYLLNDSENAVQHARLGVDLCKIWGRAEALVDGYTYLALALQAAGNTREALDTIVQAKQMASGVSSWYASLIETFEIRMHLGQGNLSPALRWASAQKSKPDLSGNPDMSEILTYITLVQTLVSKAWFRSQRNEMGCEHALENDLAEASDRLQNVIETIGAQGRIGALIDLLVLRALVLQASGDTKQALAMLEQGIGLSKAEGWRQVFLNKGQPMRELLSLATREGIEADYTKELLTAFKATGVSFSQAASGTTPLGQNLTEHLSRREIEVLHHLSLGLSNKEIAFRLTLTVNTVKKHLKNIYGKLNVHSRSRAVARARLLGLLHEPAVDRSLATGYPYP
jgi:LuxR family maltose regulon positive regulatory protein